MDRGEEREQARFVRWTHRPDVRALAPSLRWMFHCPNGGKRDAITGGQMRALGVKPGVPDLLMPVLSGRDNGLALEFKSAIGTTTPEQAEWLAHLEAAGWIAMVVRSGEEARAAVQHYLDVDLPPL